MKVFTTECKDDKTIYSMVLSDCSYNMAMDWLQRTLAKYKYEIYRTEMRTDGMVQIWTGRWYRKSYSRARCYFYDETRGILLGE